MSSHDSEPRVELTLEPRPIWLWFVLAIHLLALAALFLADLGWIARLVAAVVIAISLPRQLAAHWTRHAPRAIQTVVWLGDGRWRLTDNRGTTAGRLVEHYLGNRLIVLKFKHHPAVLLWTAGEMSSGLRQLRVRLRHGRVGANRQAGHRNRALDSVGTATMRGNR